MTILNPKDFEKLYKQIQEDLKNILGPVPTPKLHLVEEKIRKDNNLINEINETFTEANEYDVDKIKRKLNMFLKTNDLQ